MRDALVRLVIFKAAEAGALHVVTSIEEPELRGLGFQPTDGGGLVFHTSSAKPPGA
ncbi:hypothetical protein [Sinosporangium siamense]|uniref:hypothetical protein n=1 Tax=Sinosporangium siamense TaxID=1367973 RepID=UPI001EF3BD29|nr:hypothetical protein [Sinosporangium siamense]